MFAQIRDGIFHPDIILLKILHPEKEGQFHRMENAEFTWYGKLFDVVVERKSGDTTLFYCLHDKKEESLLDGYTLLIRRTGRSGSSQKDNPIHALLHNLINQALIQNSALPIHDQGITFVYHGFHPPIIPVYLVHFAPPPEFT